MLDAVARRLGERTERVGERAGDVGVDQHAHGAGRLARAVLADHREPQWDVRGSPIGSSRPPVPVTENIVAPIGSADPYAMTSSRMATSASSLTLLGASPLMIAYASSPVV